MGVDIRPGFNNFVPYSGASKDVTLGTHNLTVNTLNYTTLNPPAGAGSQTPWVSNIDGADYNLTGVHKIESYGGYAGGGTTIETGDIWNGGSIHGSHLYAANLINSGMLLICNVGGVQEGSGPHDTGSGGIGASYFDAYAYYVNSTPGASGTFLSADGFTVTVDGGIITSIV